MHLSELTHFLLIFYLKHAFKQNDKFTPLLEIKKT